MREKNPPRTLATLLSAAWVGLAIPCVAATSAAASAATAGLRAGVIAPSASQPGALTVVLETGGSPVTGIDVQILGRGATIDRDELGEPRCAVNPELNKESSAFTGTCEADGCSIVRGLILSLSNLEPITSGAALFTCDFSVRRDGAPEPIYFDVFATATDAKGNAIDVAPARSDDSISAPTAVPPSPRPTPTPATTLMMLRESIVAGAGSELAVVLDGELYATEVTAEVFVDGLMSFVAGEDGAPLCHPAAGVAVDTRYTTQGTLPRYIQVEAASENAILPLPGGVLFTCEIEARANAAPGSYRTDLIGARATDRLGRNVPLRVFGGNVIVHNPSYPTRSPTRTPTAEPLTPSGPLATQTTTAAAAPTRTPSPAAWIELAQSSEVTDARERIVDVVLHTGGLRLAGVESRIAAYSPTGIRRCWEHPDLAKPVMFSYQPPACSTSDVELCVRATAFVFSITDLEPIPDGALLYRCLVVAGGETKPERRRLFIHGAFAATPDGEQVGVRSSDLKLDLTDKPAPSDRLTLLSTRRPDATREPPTSTPSPSETPQPPPATATSAATKRPTTIAIRPPTRVAARRLGRTAPNDTSGACALAPIDQAPTPWWLVVLALGAGLRRSFERVGQLGSERTRKNATRIRISMTRQERND